MRMGRVFFANVSLALVLTYALMTVVLVYAFKMPAIGLTYILAFVMILFFGVIIFYPPKKVSFELALSFFIFIGCGLSVFAQGVLQKDIFDYFGRSIHTLTQSIFFQNSLWLFSGMAVARASYGSNNVAAWIVIAGIAALVGPNLGDGLLVSYAEIAEEGFEGVNHLLVAEMVLLLSFFSYSMSGGLFRVFLIAAIGALVFASGGRSSFYLGVASLFFYELVFGRNRRYFSLIGLALVFSAAAGALILSFENEAVQRMLFVGGVSDDLSYAERDEYLTGGLFALPEQVPFGDPGWLVRTYGSAGTYIHNVLSAWQFFGPFVFFMIVIFIVRLALRLKRANLDFREPIEIFGILCVVYGFVGILSSKFIGFSFFWFAAGFWAFRLDAGKKWVARSSARYS